MGRMIDECFVIYNFGESTEKRPLGHRDSYVLKKFQIRRKT
jgi:hypothetical protein